MYQPLRLKRHAGFQTQATIHTIQPQGRAARRLANQTLTWQVSRQILHLDVMTRCSSPSDAEIDQGSTLSLTLLQV
jgi:hypothetical protein